MRRPWGRVPVAAVAAALALVGCAPQEITPPAVTVTAAPHVPREPAPSPPADPIPAVVWPLTGADATAATAEETSRPAIAIKIPNDSGHARPQKNLEYADIVFEEYVEAGIPRLIGVFHSTYPEEVGPVRSMREMDANIIGSLDGPLVFSGANPNVMKYAKKTGQLLIAQDLGSDGFFRTKDRAAPYNLHVKLADIVEQSSGKVAPATQFRFAYPAELATAAQEGGDVSRIDLRFSRYGEPKWDWDAASGTFKRLEFNDPDLTVDGNQISATNVIVLNVRIYFNWSLPVSEMIVSNAPGYVATGGKYIPILWSKADRTAPYIITTVDGRPVSLAAGQTWIELIPNAGVSGGHANFS